MHRILPIVFLLIGFCDGLVWAASPQRNIVFILIDDLGWSDAGCYGSTFHETPHIDELAARGVRFTQAYAACPVCSPTRASILTGRHPVRLQITDWIPGNTVPADARHRFLQIEDRNELPLEEITLAEALRGVGYQTFFAGKWHLGGAGYLPTDQGFEINLGGADYGQPPGGYYAPWKNPYLKELRDGEYLTERLTEESISFLKNRDPERPFLLYLSHYDVHTPLHEAAGHFSRFQKKRQQLGPAPAAIAERRGLSSGRQENARYASMLAAVDDSVGRIMSELKSLGLLETTTVIFTSDNGGLCTLKSPGPTSNLPLRSGKGWLYEGGIRVPLLMVSPEVTQSGSVVETPVLSTDFFPTILDLISQPTAVSEIADGQSFAGALRGQAISQTRPLVWHYPHYHGSEWTPGAALREGDWKLIEFYEYGDAELYELGSDPGERHNLAAEMPEKLAELRGKLRAWQTDMGAAMPQPNGNWRGDGLGKKPGASE